ncbi:MAG: hypothetical protein GY732_11280 [Gammaproteobacteria bacterium]|nr:hypothetical protein [Gammaproteobacteria bacterium]
MLGYRSLRELRYYADDPMINRMVGLKRMPDVATISRTLSNADEHSVDKLQHLLRQMVLERLASLGARTITKYREYKSPIHIYQALKLLSTSNHLSCYQP